jgi:hypothetical protein
MGFRETTVPIFILRQVFLCLLFTYQEKTVARNATDAHAQYYVTNDELLLPVLTKRYWKGLMFSVSI